MVKNISQRNADIELLRILSMLLILGTHYVTFSGMLTNGSPVIGYAIYSFTFCCVDIFVLISGWFYGKNTETVFASSAKKASYLWMKTVLYSVLILAGYILINRQKPDAEILIETFLPFSCKKYWFLTSYIILLFAEPFLNKLIASLSEKEHMRAVIAIICFICIPSTVFQKSWLLDITDGYSVLWFVCLYIIGAYLRRVHTEIRIKNGIFPLCYVALAALIFLFYFSVNILCIKTGIEDRSTRIFRYTSLPVLLSAVCLLLFFADGKQKIRNEKLGNIICRASAVTFDIYIIHLNSLLVRRIFIDVFRTDKFFFSPFLPLHFAGTVLGIYIGLTVIAMIMHRLYDKPLKFLSGKLSDCVRYFENKIIK